MITVDENTIVEVGKYYNVPCAKMTNREVSNYYVPVIGIPHTDQQFGFKDKHLHIDGRFIGTSEISRGLVNKDGTTNDILCFEPSNAYYVVEKIVFKKRKCKRLTTGLRPPEKNSGKRTNMYWDWVDSMIGKSCKGRKCPHLGTTMIEQNGKLFCPLHNLEGCIKTEIIISSYIPI